MKTYLFLVLNIPFILFIWLCTAYFILSNLSSFKKLNTQEAIHKIDIFCDQNFPIFVKLQPHIVGVFWVLLLLYTLI